MALLLLEPEPERDFVPLKKVVVVVVVVEEPVAPVRTVVFVVEEYDRTGALGS